MASPTSKEKLDEQPDVAGSRRRSSTLQQIANCLAILMLSSPDLKDRTDAQKIVQLGRLGFDRHDIAAILDTTPGTVSVRLTINKKSKSKRRGAPKRN